MLDSIVKYCPNGHEGAWCTKFGYERFMQEMAYKEFKAWTGPKFPRVIKLNIQHANQYYDDSYAVNSENLGPYGDAINYELIPMIEKTYRGLGKWARGTYGGSTGGWEALERAGDLSRRVQRRVSRTAPTRSISTRTRRSTSTATRTRT